MLMNWMIYYLIKELFKIGNLKKLNFMKKIKWFEVYGLVDIDDKELGTETKDSFDTLKEAQDYMNEHNKDELSIDEWEKNEDGIGYAEKIKTIC